jgi:hypothetical protein
MAKKPTTKDYIEFVCERVDTINEAITSKKDLMHERNKIEKARLEWEQETRDRVDISLKEYEQLKRDLGDLRGKLERYATVFETLKINEYIDYIDPNSMTISTLKDPARMSTRVLVQFDCKTMLEFPFERKR